MAFSTTSFLRPGLVAARPRPGEFEPPTIPPRPRPRPQGPNARPPAPSRKRKLAAMTSSVIITTIARKKRKNSVLKIEVKTPTIPLSIFTKIGYV